MNGKLSIANFIFVSKIYIYIYNMNSLELFSGTGSIGKVAMDFGHHVISLDKDMDADIKTDILDWDYKAYDPGYFD